MLRTLLGLTCILSACPSTYGIGGGATDATGVVSVSTDGSTTSPSNTGDLGSDATITTGTPTLVGIDILFVIDNSGSMAEEARRLVAGIPEFLSPLSASGQSIRVAITTTDNGNPRCPVAETTPEAGALVTTSCIERISQGDFLFDGVDPPYDGSYACTDYCSLSSAELGNTLPWVEFTGMANNLADGVSVSDALRCLLPVGISGCGFESQLESMYRALERAVTMDDPSYGFIRPGALLVIILVTDEADCSYNDQFKDIFINNKVFWNEPNDPIPTSAVCWRAGVTCLGPGPTYSTCMPDNHDISGSGGVPDANAVLHPISRYLERLGELNAAKQSIFGTPGVQVHILAGVPPGYQGPQDAIYEDSDDTVIQGDFGIGPACQDENGGTAVPVVRARVVAESIAAGSYTAIRSICQEDYSADLAAIAQVIIAAIPG